ncbi:MAG: T9SS type A sorting domain-containing protein [Bacteroidia bacterium]|nr:T9SS type A sorting domain-containing protein [Bacteroidia bacterium]
MKKGLLSILAVSSALLASAQCTPDPNLFVSVAGGKLLPDTATFNNDPQYAYQLNTDYSAVFNLKTITDTTASGLSVKIIKIKYIGMDGAPAGTVVTTDQADDTWENAGTFPNLTPVVGCATVTVPGASLANSATYDLTLKVDLLLNIAGQEQWYSALPAPIGTGDYIKYAGYKLNASTGIETLNTADLNLVVYPNPFSTTAQVSFSMKNAGKVSLNVTDITGKVVRTASIDGKSGVNNYQLNKDNLQAGIYFINLTSGEKTITEKVSIQ